MPTLPVIQIPIQIKSGAHISKYRIKTALDRALRRALSTYSRLMIAWAQDNVPEDTSNLITAFISGVASSPAQRAFTLDVRSVPYAVYVNAMSGVKWTKWGIDRSKDHFFKRSIPVAFKIAKQALIDAIIAEGLDTTVGVSPSEAMNVLFQTVGV